MRSERRRSARCMGHSSCERSKPALRDTQRRLRPRHRDYRAASRHIRHGCQPYSLPRRTVQTRRVRRNERRYPSIHGVGKALRLRSERGRRSARGLASAPEDEPGLALHASDPQKPALNDRSCIRPGAIWAPKARADLARSGRIGEANPAGRVACDPTPDGGQATADTRLETHSAARAQSMIEPMAS